jgi:Protein of unknown function (DUF3105)
MRRVLGALLVATVVLTACASDDDGDDGVPFASEGGGDCTADTEMDVYSTEGEGVVHTDHPSYRGPLGNPPRYTVDPPSGGDHVSPSVGPGAYQGDNVPPDGVLVHSLEHGYVILWHGPGIPEEDLGDIEDVRQEYRRDVIVVERPSLSVPVAATAWGHRLLCQAADPAELAEFVEERRNQAPEKIPH